MRHLGLAALAVAGSVSTAHAEALEMYFTSGPFDCGRGQHTSELIITGDTSSEVTVTYFSRQLGSGWQGRQWTLPTEKLNAPAGLAETGTRPKYDLSGVLEKQPKLIVLDRKGQPDDDCQRSYVPADKPSQRYEAALEFLNTQTPEPLDALKRFAVVDGLPPIGMLPELSQAETKQALRDAQKGFEDRYGDTMIVRAGDLQDQAVLPDLFRVYAEVPKRDVAPYVRLQLRAQQTRVEAALQNDVDPVAALSPPSVDTLCDRVDNTRQSWNWDEYLGLMTGIPVAFWTTEIAEENLAASKACEKGEIFSKTVAKQWPDIQKRADAVRQLTSERDRIAAIEVSLPQLRDANWLLPDRDLIQALNRAGISKDFSEAYLAPVLDQKTEEAIQRIPDEMLANVPSDMTTKGLMQFCEQQAETYGRVRAPVFKDIFDACENQATDMAAERTIAAIDARRDLYLASDPTLQNLLNSNGFSYDDLVPSKRGYGDAYERFMIKIRGAVAAAEKQTMPLFDEAIKAAEGEITQAFARANPELGSDQGVTIPAPCNDQGMRSSRSKLRALYEICDRVGADYMTRNREARCQKVWDETDAPAEMADGTLEIYSLLGGARQVPLSKLLCDASMSDRFDLRLEADKGLFSTDYRLVRRVNVEGTDVTYSVRLSEPDEKGKLVFDDPQLEPIEFASAPTAQDDLLNCLMETEVCYITQVEGQK